jgi:hypothetical protein
MAAPSSAHRPVPWRRLSWVAWRRYRPSLLASGTLLVLVALYVAVRGHDMRDAYAAYKGCVPQSAASCRFRFDNFHNTYGNTGFLGGVLLFVPALVGAFAGAPLLGRELETGTFRYAWTQGAGRMRWLVSLLVPGAVGVAAVSAAFGVLITWYEQPLVNIGIEQRLHESVFPITGVAVVGWALLAYSTGVLAGLLIRRVVPALAATLAVWTGLAYLASAIRPTAYHSPRATSRLQLGTHDLPVHQWWTHAGARVGDAQINHLLQAIGVQTGNGGGNFQVSPGGGSVDPVQYLIQHGYTQWSSYQPDSRYWPFQGIEFGWLILVSVILLAATLWLVRRRGA